jgi:hypothetical protein
MEAERRALQAAGLPADAAAMSVQELEEYLTALRAKEAASVSGGRSGGGADGCGSEQRLLSAVSQQVSFGVGVVRGKGWKQGRVVERDAHKECC